MRTQLKVFRVVQNMSQREISEKMGCKRAYYGHVENGLRNGSSEFWGKLQAAFGLTDVVVEELKKVD